MPKKTLNTVIRVIPQIEEELSEALLQANIDKIRKENVIRDLRNRLREQIQNVHDLSDALQRTIVRLAKHRLNAQRKEILLQDRLAQIRYMRSQMEYGSHTNTHFLQSRFHKIVSWCRNLFRPQNQ